MHRNFFSDKKISQKKQNVDNFCDDRNIPFRFGIRKWVIDQLFKKLLFSKILPLNGIFQGIFNNIKTSYLSKIFH